MNDLFVPQAFKVPDHLVSDQFRFDILSPVYAKLDYETVMSSRHRLTSVFNESDDWPDENMTFEMNLEDLTRHEAEFHAREAFAYSVFSPCKTRYIGCVYINPTIQFKYDCEVYLWVSHSEKNLDQALFAQTKNWIVNQWPFRNIAFPGRQIPWAQWKGAS